MVRGLYMPYFVYILVNPERKTYVGQTSNFHERLKQHNDLDCYLTLHTKRHRGPWKLLHVEECATRKGAMKREKQLKSGGGRRFIRSLLEESGC